MRRARVPRRLTVGRTVWLWSVGHLHPECHEILTVRRADARHAQLRLVFRAGAGRPVAGAYRSSGLLGDAHDNTLNLHEPGVVLRFLEEAGSRGLLPDAHGMAEADGWPLFDAIVRDLGSGPAAGTPQ
ncbi:hypothetical protein ACFU5O_02635 [Streptomyces sp. NPDC057445]|uniref:hypothetical protein n=1 Tax=Streptomyces sp. NPDC057445 TaxID=3346136 RepID=UPI00367965BF